VLRFIAPITTLVIGFSALVLGIYIGAENFNRDRCIPVKSQPQRTVSKGTEKVSFTSLFAETEEEFQTLLREYKEQGYVVANQVKDPVTNRKFAHLVLPDGSYLYLHGYIFPPKHSN